MAAIASPGPVQAPDRGAGLNKLMNLATIGAGIATGGVGGALMAAQGGAGLLSKPQAAPIQSQGISPESGAIGRRISSLQNAPQNQIAEGLRAAAVLPAQRRAQVEDTLRKAYEASQVQV